MKKTGKMQVNVARMMKPQLNRPSLVVRPLNDFYPTSSSCFRRRKGIKLAILRYW